MKIQLLGFALLTVAISLSAKAHSDDGNESEPFIEPIAYGLPQSRVSITQRGDKRIIESNDIPNHEPGRFPNPGNPNTIQPQNFHYEVPLHPVQAPSITPMKQMDFGVAVNGVKFLQPRRSFGITTALPSGTWKPSCADAACSAWTGATRTCNLTARITTTACPMA